MRNDSCQSDPQLQCRGVRGVFGAIAAVTTARRWDPRKFAQRTWESPADGAIAAATHDASPDFRWRSPCIVPGIVNRKPLSADHKPGPLPDITSDDDSVTFVMALPELGAAVSLRLRCDVRGEVWVALDDADERSRTW